MSILEEKSYTYSIRIIMCSEYLQQEKKEFILSKQFLRSGAAMEVLVAESNYAQSKLDFINKLSISLKEANETKSWLRLLKDRNYLQEKLALSLLDDIEKLIRILAPSIKNSKRKQP